MSENQWFQLILWTRNFAQIHTVWLTYPFDSGFCNFAMKKGALKAVFIIKWSENMYLNILYLTLKITNVLKIHAISKSWVMLRTRVSATKLTLRCERKTSKNGYVEVSFWPLIFSSVQNLTFYGLKKNINAFSHRLMLKIELKKVFFMA